MRLLGMLTKTVEPEAIVLSFEERVNQAVADKLAENRRKWQQSFDYLDCPAERGRLAGLADRRHKWQSYFEWRFDTQVPIENIVLGDVPTSAKIYVSECEFEFRAGDSWITTDCYLRWRCPVCGSLSDEAYVANLVSVGRVLSRLHSQHVCG